MLMIARIVRGISSAGRLQFVRRSFPLQLLDKKVMSIPVLYHSVEDVLSVLEQHQSSIGVQKVLKLYNDLVAKADKAGKPDKLHPLIVLEGLDGCGKSTTTKKLANKINADLYRTPPPSISDIREHFEDNGELRTAFYAMGNYIAALEMQSILKDKPVVLDRYWHSTAAFAIAQATHDNPDTFPMPATGDAMYNWPSDLLKPNVVFLLEVVENIRMQRLSRRTSFTNQERLLKDNREFRENVITAYKAVNNPEITCINANGYPKKVIASLLESTHDLFN